jgi:hypothetical protein
MTSPGIAEALAPTLAQELSKNKNCSSVKFWHYRWIFIKVKRITHIKGQIKISIYRPLSRSHCTMHQITSYSPTQHIQVLLRKPLFKMFGKIEGLGE